jgi:phosphatidylinositol alpha-1,6-mannosyltransferase
MRPAVVTSQLPPDLGGTSVYAHEIARGLEALGERPFVLIRDRDPQDPDLDLEIVNVDTRRGLLKPLRLRRAQRECLAHVREKGSRVVLFAYPVSGFGDLYGALERAGIPYAVSVHGIRRSDLESESARRKRRKKWGLAGAALVLANSRWTADQVRALGVPDSRLAVVYLGVDPAIARSTGEAALRAKLGLEGKRVLVSVGRLTPQKNQDAVLRALAALAPRHPDVFYVIVGDGHARPALEALARDLGVAAHVRFAGSVARSEIGAYYRLAHLQVLVPRAKAEDDSLESFGLAYVEAALCGVASIGARTSGIPEAVIDGETGLLVDPEDGSALAPAIERLLRDDALRARLGAAAEERARARFSWERCALETRDALARVALPR